MENTAPVKEYDKNELCKLYQIQEGTFDKWIARSNISVRTLAFHWEEAETLVMFDGTLIKNRKKVYDEKYSIEEVERIFAAFNPPSMIS